MIEITQTATESSSSKVQNILIKVFRFVDGSTLKQESLDLVVSVFVNRKCIIGVEIFATCWTIVHKTVWEMYRLNVISDFMFSTLSALFTNWTEVSNFIWFFGKILIKILKTSDSLKNKKIYIYSMFKSSTLQYIPPLNRE